MGAKHTVQAAVSTAFCARMTSRTSDCKQGRRSNCLKGDQQRMKELSLVRECETISSAGSLAHAPYPYRVRDQANRVCAGNVIYVTKLFLYFAVFCCILCILLYFVVFCCILLYFAVFCCI